MFLVDIDVRSTRPRHQLTAHSHPTVNALLVWVKFADISEYNREIFCLFFWAVEKLHKARGGCHPFSCTVNAPSSKIPSWGGGSQHPPVLMKPQRATHLRPKPGLTPTATQYPRVVHHIHCKCAFAPVVCRLSDLANDHRHPQSRWIATLSYGIDLSVRLETPRRRGGAGDWRRR